MIKNMNIKKIILVALSTLVGLVFIASGYFKLYPIENLEYAIMDTGLVGFNLAPFFAKLLIWIELMLGIFLILRIDFNGLVLWTTILMLTVFSIYLSMSLFKGQNQENCGCFGDFIELSTRDSLLKNMLLIVFCSVLVKFQKK